MYLFDCWLKSHGLGLWIFFSEARTNIGLAKKAGSHHSWYYLKVNNKCLTVWQHMQGPDHFRPVAMSTEKLWALISGLVKVLA